MEQRGKSWLSRPAAVSGSFRKETQDGGFGGQPWASRGAGGRFVSAFSFLFLFTLFC